MDLDMYAEALIYTYEHPKNKGVISGATTSIDEENISCGDKITVYISIDKTGKVSDIKFDGAGCVISMGSADVLIEALRGKTLTEIEKFGKKELLELISIDPGPVRMHCATLALRAIKKAVLSYEGKPIDRGTREL